MFKHFVHFFRKLVKQKIWNYELLAYICLTF